MHPRERDSVSTPQLPNSPTSQNPHVSDCHKSVSDMVFEPWHSVHALEARLVHRGSQLQDFAEQFGVLLRHCSVRQCAAKVPQQFLR